MKFAWRMLKTVGAIGITILLVVVSMDAATDWLMKKFDDIWKGFDTDTAEEVVDKCAETLCETVDDVD